MKYQLVNIVFGKDFVIGVVTGGIIKRDQNQHIDGCLDKIYYNTTIFANCTILNTSGYFLKKDGILFETDDEKELEERAMLEIL